MVLSELVLPSGCNRCDELAFRFLLNLSVRETAVSMDLTEANVKVIQFRALKRAAELDGIATRRPARSN